LLFFSRASSVAYANGARVCFNKPLAGRFSLTRTQSRLSF